MLTDSLADTWHIAQAALLANLEGIGESDARKPAPGGGNSIAWITGHIVSAREGILRATGQPRLLKAKEMAMFARGSEGLAEDAAFSWPRLEEAVRVTGNRVATLIGGLGAERMSEAVPVSRFPMPVEHPTYATLITFLLFHEAYHVGQIGILRRCHGYAGSIQ